MKFGLESFNNTIRELSRILAIGLSRLSFEDNFVNFTWSGEIAAGSEVNIRNPLSLVPRGYIIFKQKGNGLLTAGDVEWTSTIVTLKNHGAVSVTTTVIFFK